jgi:hypothetical protein
MTGDLRPVKHRVRITGLVLVAIDFLTPTGA